MKKFIFTSLLTIASSLWAFCNASVQLPSLCDEWHLQTYTIVDPDNPSYHEYTQRLTTDTTINGKQYRQLRGMAKWQPYSQNDNNYLGALREENNAHIYYIPAGGTHEFLLYAFNVEVGDTLTNLWIGNNASESNGYKATVTNISTGNVRRIDLHIFDTDDNQGVDCWDDTYWLDSIGRLTGPVWADPLCYAIDPSPEVICACKEGRKVYARNANCKCSPFRLSSLCDTWNVLDFRYNWGYGDDEYILHHYHLTTDTVINTRRYVKLYKGNGYRGALREGNNAKIYYIPADSTGEYLLYDFNVQVGDTLDNLWYDHSTLSFSRVRTIVTEIQETLPRTIVLTVNIFDDEGVETVIDWQQQLYWIEGVGHANAAPDSYGWLELAGGYTTNLQCAYKDGELVYASEAFDGYGCNDGEQPSDTIPLYRYTGDDPGSSTVDPVDPNQVVVILQGDNLTIREFSGDEIGYTLTNMHTANAPARNRSAQADTFRNSVSVQLTEDGRYTLNLTNPEWGYNIYGTFDYGRDAFVPVTSETVATKILHNGRLLIQYDGKTFTLTGLQVE